MVKFLTLTGAGIILFLSGLQLSAQVITKNQPDTDAFNPSLLTVANTPCQIVINEMMVDPTPLIGLPDFEWIEILNTGSCQLNLKDWKLVVGTSLRVLPETVMPPGGFLIVCSATAVPQFEKFGKTLALSSFPALRNTGNRVAIITPEGLTVDVVDYTDAWYNDKVKKDGGWTLERIDPERFCGQAVNWTASLDQKGGTPGAKNSVFASNTDNTVPAVTGFGAISTTAIEIFFSEPMDTLLLVQIKNYTLSDGYNQPASVVLLNDAAVRLLWKNPFQINRSYQLQTGGLTDVCGNMMVAVSLPVSWIKLEPGDVVVNEILFNPRVGSVDFVEIFNRSGKTIDSRKLSLASRDSEMKLKQVSSLASAKTVIYPGQYLAVAIDTLAIRSFYFTVCPNCVRKITSIPSFNNDQGRVVLLSDSLVVLDEFVYTEKMHHRLLTDVDGISLERVNPDSPTLQTGNWQSASASVGYATPGYQNSQYQLEPAKSTKVTIEPPAISPNNDGYNDELLIHFETQQPGWVANGWVFDTSGRQVCQLFKNELLSTNGTLKWDGKNETGQQIPVGPYVIILELFDLNGNIERFKKAVIITDRWQ